MQPMSSVPALSATDSDCVRLCEIAFRLYYPCAHIRDMVRNYHDFTGTLFRDMHINELVVSNLSFKIHIRYDMPYSYVQQYIWEKILADAGHDISLDSEFGNRVDWNRREENTIMDTVIGVEMRDEDRILVLPAAPIFSACDILQLQKCVSQIHYMCLRLPEDISHKVCSRGLYANYEISPGVYEHYLIDADEGPLRSLCAQRLVEKGLACGGIRIDIQSAFWIHYHLPLEISKWRLDDVTDLSFSTYQELVQDLVLFPEIDQEIITKIAAMMMHPNWHSA